jgi:hypothetical protein
VTPMDDHRIHSIPLPAQTDPNPDPYSILSQPAPSRQRMAEWHRLRMEALTQARMEAQQSPW